jgi:hypothetical protein
MKDTIKRLDGGSYSKSLNRAVTFPKLARASIFGSDPRLVGVSLSRHRKRCAPEIAVIQEMAGRGVVILEPSDILADETGFCRAERIGRALYSDDRHLSAYGARQLVPLSGRSIVTETNGTAAEDDGDMPRKRTVSERIRQTIETADVTRYRIAQETRFEQSALSRFMSGERGLSQEAIDGLAEFFGLELVPRQKRKGT